MSEQFDESSWANSHRVISGLVVGGVTLGAWVVVAAVGSNQATRDERILGCLYPIVSVVRDIGANSSRWMTTHLVATGVLLSLIAFSILAASRTASGRISVPLSVAVGAVVAAVWGEVLILHQNFLCGTAAFAAAALLAFVLANQTPAADWLGPESETPSQRSRTLETLSLIGLVLAALVMRTVALTELPTGFDKEMVSAMLQSRTAHGVWTYLGETFVGSPDGFAHIATHWAVFETFGTSYFTLRMAPVLWGVAAVPLFYWFVRRTAGVRTAFFGTVLFLSAPEQLFWSRTENAYFAPTVVYALVSAHLVLWLVRIPSLRAASANAVWMSLSSLFYFPSVVMSFLPVVASPALLWRPDVSRRTRLTCVGIVLLGLLGFLSGKTVIVGLTHPGSWRFVNPLSVHGQVAWKSHLDNQVAPPLGIVQQHIDQLGTTVPQLGLAFSFSNPNATHWCQRFSYGDRPSPALNVAVFVLLVLGLAALVSRINNPTALTIVLWLILGLAPGLLSDGPAPRRLMVAYPAISVTVAVFLGLVSRLQFPSPGHKRLSLVISGSIGTAIIFIAVTQVGSHFMLPTEKIAASKIGDALKPVLSRNNTIRHTIPVTLDQTILLGSLDDIVASSPATCIEGFDISDWPAIATNMECRFEDELYRILFPQDTISGFRSAHRPAHVAYIVTEGTGFDRVLKGLDILFPLAQRSTVHVPSSEIPPIQIVEVAPSDLARTDGFEYWSQSALDPSPGRTTRRFLGIEVSNKPADSLSPCHGCIAQLRAGLVIPNTGWYRIDSEPQGASVRISVDGKPIDLGKWTAFGAGVHLFEAEWYDIDPTTDGVTLNLRGHLECTPRSLTADMLIPPEISLLESITLPDPTVFEGFDHAEEVSAFSQGALDLGIDRQLRVFTLHRTHGEIIVRRISPDQDSIQSWRVRDVDGESGALAVSPNGNVAVVGRHTVAVFDSDGKRLHRWRFEHPEPVTDAAYLSDNRLAFSVLDFGTIDVYQEDGLRLDSIDEFKGSSRPFERPIGLSIDAADRLLVIEEGGRVLVSDSAQDSWPPRVGHEFQADLGWPADPRGCLLTDGNIIAIPEQFHHRLHFFDVFGRVLMAVEPQRDLRNMNLQHVVSITAHNDRWYVLDDGRQALLSTTAGGPL
jgi:hypothetical protein